MNSFQYFLQLTKIPRPSGKEEKIANWLIKTISKMGYKVVKDKYQNVIAYVDNGKDKTVILEAHTDMVCESKIGTKFNFDKSGINTYIQGDYITAIDTTLGADDGYGVALILNVLEHNTSKYPNIIAVFTTQEETSMDGAKNLDFSKIQADYMLGLDGTESNDITISCACGIFLELEKEIKLNQQKCNIYELTLNNCLSGHSGEEIHKNRANAIKEIFKFLSQINTDIISVNGGTKDNVIPSMCTVQFRSDDNVETKLNDYIAQFKTTYPEEKYAQFNLCTYENKECNIIENSNYIVKYINEFDNGVLVYDKNTQLPLTSINLAKINTVGNKIIINAMFRSNLDNQDEYKEAYISKAKEYGFNLVKSNYAPLYTSLNNQQLTDICVDTYKSLFESTPKLTNIHAGLEGGVFANNIPGLQCVTLGADLNDIHTINERMKISSLVKLEKWIDAILKMLNLK